MAGALMSWYGLPPVFLKPVEITHVSVLVKSNYYSPVMVLGKVNTEAPQAANCSSDTCIVE